MRVLDKEQGTSKVKRDGTSESEYGGVAQLGEHLLCKQGVIGSNPFISTTPADGKKPEQERAVGKTTETPERVQPWAYSSAG